MNHFYWNNLYVNIVHLSMSKPTSPELISSTGIYLTDSNDKDKKMNNKGLYYYIKKFLQKRREEKEKIVTRQNKKCFHQVEIDFTRVLYHISQRRKEKQMIENIIKTEKERDMLVKYGNILVTIEPYKKLSIDQIYMVLIFVYYGLVLLEQPCDWLTSKNIKFYYDNELYEIAKKLVFDLSCYDIVYENDRNLSSEVRRDFLGLYNL